MTTKLTLAQYAPLARKTLKEMDLPKHLEHMGLGIIGELGEFADAVKKHFVYGNGVDPTNPNVKMKVVDGGVLDRWHLSEEAGDTMWYVANALPELGVDLSLLQTGIVEGFEQGRMWHGTSNALVLQVMAQVAQAVVSLQYPLHPQAHRDVAVGLVGKNIGMLYTHFALDFESSLGLNIAKLAERYGDAYSDDAALVRDLIAERKILLGGVQTGGAQAQQLTLGDVLGEPLSDANDKNA